jgi:type IV fimbrial biogenesis protein FimT
MPKTASRPARVRGFTLVELVIGLAVAGVLFGLALPSFARFLAEQRLLGEARRLSEAIMLARTEAVKRNGHVVLCATTPTLPCGSARHWHEGWVMFVDGNADAEVDPGEALIGREGAAAEGVTLVGNRPVATYFRFDYLGQARMASGALQMGTVDVCRSGLRGYEVVLANSGRTRIDRLPSTCP